MDALDISNTPAKSLDMPRVKLGQVWTGRLTKYLGRMATVEDVAKDHITLRHHASNFRSKISLSTLISSYRLAEEADIAAAARAVQVDGTDMLKTTATPRASPDRAKQRDRSAELPPAEMGTVVEAPVDSTPATTSKGPRYKGFDPTVTEALEGIESGKARVAKNGDVSFSDGDLSTDGKRALAQNLDLIRCCASGAWEKSVAAWPEPFSQRWREANAANVLAGQSPKVAAWQAYVDLVNRWRASIASAFVSNVSATSEPAKTTDHAPVAPTPTTQTDGAPLALRDLASTRILEAIEAGEIRLDEAGAVLHSRGGMSEEDGHAISRNAALVSDCISGRWKQIVTAWPEPLEERWREAKAANVRAGQRVRVAAWQAFVDLSGRWKMPRAKSASPDKVTGAPAAQPSPTVSDGDLSAAYVPFHDDKILVLWNGQRPWVPVFLVARRVGVGDASVVSRIARRYPDTDVAKLRTALTNDKGFPRISVCVSPEVLHHWLGSVQFSADAATLSVYRAGARDAINTHLGDLFGYVAPAPSALPADEPEAQVTTASESANNGATAEPVAPQTCAPDDSHPAEEVNAEVCDAPRCDMVRRVNSGQMVNVPFHGDKIAAVRDGDDVWIPVRPVCERFGISFAAQTVKLDSSPWATVSEIETVAGDDKARNMLAIHLRSFAAWLFSIHAGKVAPHLREPLIRYQQEASDVLYRHFLAARFDGAHPIAEPSVDASRLDRLEQRLVTISEENRRTSELMLASVQAVQQLAAAVARPHLAQPIDAATAAENARKAGILDERKRNASDREQNTKALSRVYPAIRDTYLPLLQQFIGQHLEVVNLMDPKARSRCVGAGQTKDMFVKWLKEKTSYDAPTEQVIYWMISDITDGVKIEKGRNVMLPFALKLNAVPDPRQTTIPGVGGK